MLRSALVLTLMLAGLSASTAPAPEKPRKGSENEGSEELDMLRSRAQWWFERHKGAGGKIPWNARGIALAQLAANTRAGRLKAARGAPVPDAIEGDVWLPIGPRPIADGPYSYAGRVTALATVPGSPDVVYLGAAQGGAWKTTDGGVNWTPLTDGQDSLAVGAIAIDPSNTNVVYVGTGEANQSCDSHYGVGVLKSLDGGSTWTTLGASVFQNTSIGKIVVHPTDGMTVYAANGSGTAGFSCYGQLGTFGVWKSVDGGASWIQVLGSAQIGSNKAVQDLVRSPSDPNTLYAAVNGSGIWKTTNAGTTWTKLAGGLPTTDISRFDIGVDPGNASVLYALVARSSTGAERGTYKSINAGTTWIALPNQSGSCHYWNFQDICTYSGNSSGQCWYDLAIEVQPGGAVWAGGTGIFRSTSAGSTWTDVCPQSVHVDQHAIAFGSDGRIWIGNDGGVWASSDNGATWINKNGTLQITQFYPGAALDPTRYDGALAGAQDNGSPRFTGGATWDLATFGDGAACVIYGNNPATTWYTSSQYLSIYKTDNAGLSYFAATSGLLDAGTGAAPFIGQFASCVGDPNVLIAGSDNVWRTDDGAGLWQPNSPDPIDPTAAPIVTVAMAASDRSCATYAVGTRSGRVYLTADAGADWANITGVLPARALNDLAFDPSDPNVLYIAVSGFGVQHLYRTENALSPAPDWFAIDAGIPDAPINAVLVDPDAPRVLYAGSDLGLFKSADYGGSWALQTNGIPKIAIYDLVADPSTRALVAFTHGRGAFRLNLVCTPPTFGGVGAAVDAAACGTGVDISWSAPTRWGQLATTGTYEVQRFDGAGCAGAPTVVATGIPASTLAVSDASTVAGATYSYRVVATNDCAVPASDPGASPCSPPVTDAADVAPCGDVGDTLLVSSDTIEASLAWNPVACNDLASYAVYASTSYSAEFPAEWTLIGSPGAPALTDSLASPFVAYRVVTLDACGNLSGD